MQIPKLCGQVIAFGPQSIVLVVPQFPFCTTMFPHSAVAFVQWYASVFVSGVHAVFVALQCAVVPPVIPLQSHVVFKLGNIGGFGIISPFVQKVSPTGQVGVVGGYVFPFAVPQFPFMGASVFVAVQVGFIPLLFPSHLQVIGVVLGKIGFGVGGFNVPLLQNAVSVVEGYAVSLV